MKVTLYWSAVVVLALGRSAFAQDAPALPTPLVQLLAEAGVNNSQISAADHARNAASHAARQATTLPDPKLTLQQFSVGSPKPFAGYTNSNFAYIGLGASQELPYPGKLKLRGKAAEREADVQQAQGLVTRKDVADAVKSDYVQLASLQQTLRILRENESVLTELIQDAIVRYQVGQGQQQDVLKAQAERTRMLLQITTERQSISKIQAHLKGLLERDQTSLDIQPEDLAETVLKLTSADLLDLVRQNNPEVQASAIFTSGKEARLASAQRDGKPDFEIGYMYQNTDRKYRDYYMLTLGVRIPRKGRVDAEIGEAAETLAQSKAAAHAQIQQQLAATQQQYADVISDAESLTLYRDGLIPQTEAAYRATLNSYGSNLETFPHVLTAFIDVLNLRIEMVKTLANHELAMAHLESLTGATLR